MNWDVLLDYGFLLLFTVTEVVAVLYFYDGMRPDTTLRRYGLPVMLTLILFLWNALSLTAKQTRDIYSILYVLETCLTLLVFVRLYCRCQWRECFYSVVVFFLSTRFLRHLIGHLMISAHSTNYLVEGSFWILRLLSCLGLLGVYLLILTPVRKMTFRYDLTQQNPWYLGLIMLTVVPILYIGTFAETLGQESWARGLEAIVIEGIASVCGFLTIIGYQWMMAGQKKTADLRRMETMLKLQYQQVENRREMMELVNQKYHDMKNHLQVLNQLEDNERRRHYLKTLFEQMQGMENFYETSNQTLDVILTDKHEQCMKKQIQLMIIAQGELLSFLEPADLTTLFANALDNAIEHVEQLPIEKRQIDLKVIRRQSWCLIRVENPCDEDQLSWDANQLRTTKKVPGHGLGLKSIRYTVEQYGGTMTAEIQQHRFILTMLLPLPEALLKD